MHDLPPNREAPVSSPTVPATSGRLRLLKRPSPILHLELTRFIGRDRTIAQVQRLLATTRLRRPRSLHACGAAKTAHA